VSKFSNLLARLGKRPEFSYACQMAIDSILAQIDSEIARLTQVRSLLSNTGKPSTGVSGQALRKSPAKKAPKKRVLSAEARKRIAQAQRKRWAAQRAKNKGK
jgi:hypothetical protein